MQQDIVALLQLFAGRVPDPVSHARVLELAQNRQQWQHAHDLFDQLRDGTLRSIAAKDHARECQYYFEEVCLQSLYNETGPSDPFDPDSPYWILKNAIALAWATGVSLNAVAAAVLPGKGPVKDPGLS